MIICHSLKFVFIHNPKVAGTAMRRAIIRHLTERGEKFTEMHGRAIINDEIIDSAHVPVRLWTKEIQEAYDNDYYFFVVVKDPRKKFASAMSEFRFQHPEFLSALMPIDAPQSEYERVLRNLLSYNSIRYDWRFGHFAPQSQFFCRLDMAPSGEVQPTRLEKIRVFTLESVENWWDTLMSTLGMRGCGLREERTSLHYPAQPFMPETLDLIARLYAVDFKALLGKDQPDADASIPYLPIQNSWKPEYEAYMRLNLARMKSWEKIETFLTYPNASYPENEGWLLSNIREKNAFENRLNRMVSNEQQAG